MSRTVAIVGAGLFGATCAYELRKAGFQCIVIDRRAHIGGNCFTEERDGINIHKYGPHIFHTKSRKIWEWIGQFVEFNQYRHRIKVNYEGKIYSFPPNLATFYEIWGVTTPNEAEQVLRSVVESSDSQESSLESWALAQVGRQIYEIFIKGYTEKHWRQPASALPASIIKRIPLRFSFDDNYFDDPYQGIPIGGYTRIFEQLLEGADLALNTDYFDVRAEVEKTVDLIIYSGPLDRLAGYRYGNLEYRSNIFEFERLSMKDYQGAAQVNFTSKLVPYTRIVEHKHFEMGEQAVTWITREYPAGKDDSSSEEMYPIRDERNLSIFKKYQRDLDEPEFKKYILGGRLGEYQYYDMHQVIGSALKVSRDIIESSQRDYR